MKLRALSCARRASGPAASTPPQGVSTPSTGTCSSLQQLLNALLASSPAARAVRRGKRNEAYHEHRRRRAVEAAYLVRRPRGTRPPFFSWTARAPTTMMSQARLSSANSRSASSCSPECRAARPVRSTQMKLRSKLGRTRERAGRFFFIYMAAWKCIAFISIRRNRHRNGEFFFDDLLMNSSSFWSRAGAA